MAEMTGEIAAVYYNEELTVTATTGTLMFSTGKTITSSTAGGTTGPFINFESTGFHTGMLFTLSGCEHAVGATGISTTANNRIFTISAVSTNSVTVSEAMQKSTGESGAVVFTQAEPGYQVMGCYNWGLSYTGDAVEVTNFDSTGGREYITGLTGWTATADRYFLTTGVETDGWVGNDCELRLFLNYRSSTSTPSTGSPSYYWKGDTIVTGIDVTTPIDAMVSESISFQGNNALEFKTQDQAWSSGITT